MANKAKEELDLLYDEKGKKKTKKKNSKKILKENKKSNKKNSEENRKTKEERFDFNEEIVIGLTRIPDEKKNEPKPINKKRVEKLANAHKQKKKQVRNKKTERNSNTANNEVVISDIYSKQNQVHKSAKKNKENQTKKNKQNKKVYNQPKKLTKEQELAKKKRKAIFRLIKWTSLFAIIVAGSIFTLLSPIFNIEKIDIYGNSKISNDEIISLSGIEIGKNTFQYKKAEIIEKIKQNAYIESVAVKRKFPKEIEIVLEERKATYMIQIGNAYAYINNQGYILEIAEKKSELPILIGINTLQEEIQPGNRLNLEDLKKLSDVLKIIESATSNKVVGLITTINIEDKDNYLLTLEDYKKIVHLGDTSNLSTKMLWIVKFNEQEKDTEGEIFLNMNLNNEESKPYFRKKV